MHRARRGGHVTDGRVWTTRLRVRELWGSKVFWGPDVDHPKRLLASAEGVLDSDARGRRSSCARCQLCFAYTTILWAMILWAMDRYKNKRNELAAGCLLWCQKHSRFVAMTWACFRQKWTELRVAQMSSIGVAGCMATEEAPEGIAPAAVEGFGST